MQKLLSLMAIVAVAACAQVDPDTYQPVGGQYGRSDGWHVDSSGNWQMIVNGSATGTYLDSSGNIVTSNDLTVSGTSTLSGVSSVTNADDDDKITWGTDDDAYMEYDVAVQTVDTLVMGLPSVSRGLVIVDAADTATDFSHAQQTNPTVFIQSADQATVADYLSLAHNQTNAVIASGAGDIIANPAGSDFVVGAGGAGLDYTLTFDGEDADGVITWGEDEDAFTVADAITFSSTVAVTGAASLASSLSVVSQTLGIDFFSFRIYDNYDAILDQAAADDDDLTLVQGTPGTTAVTIETIDCGGLADTTQKAAFQFVMPPTYLAGSTVTLSANAGMITTVADQSATLDFTCWVPDYANEDATVSSDLITTAAQSVNSATFATKSFTLDDDVSGYELAAGDVVQCHMIALCDDDGNAGDAITIRVNFLKVVIST